MSEDQYFPPRRPFVEKDDSTYPLRLPFSIAYRMYSEIPHTRAESLYDIADPINNDVPLADFVTKMLSIPGLGLGIAKYFSCIPVAHHPMSCFSSL